MFLVGVRRKHLHCPISRRPITAISKHWESKCLYIPVYLRRKNYPRDAGIFYLVEGGLNTLERLIEGGVEINGEGVENSPNLNKLGKGGGGRLENSWKFNSRGGVEEILFDMLKSNAKNLKCFGLLSLFKTTNFCTKCILLDINVE